MLVVLEGLDGVGKSMQSKLLVEKYQASHPQFYHFPRYEHRPFGNLIAQFLQGNLGDITQTNAYFIALLFACDQYALMRDLNTKEHLVILDRYFYSNLAYQSAKLESEKEREAFRSWLDEVVTFFALPQPDLLFYLTLPEEIMQANLLQRQALGSSDRYEEDYAFQQRVAVEYELMMTKYGNAIPINCADATGWRSAESIHAEIDHHVQQRLQVKSD